MKNTDRKANLHLMLFYVYDYVVKVTFFTDLHKREVVIIIIIRTGNVFILYKQSLKYN